MNDADVCLMLWCMWDRPWVPIIRLQLIIGSYRTYQRSDVKALRSSELLGPVNSTAHCYDPQHQCCVNLKCSLKQCFCCHTLLLGHESAAKCDSRREKPV
jgi:hypothetical protein